MSCVIEVNEFFFFFESLLVPNFPSVGKCLLDALFFACAFTRVLYNIVLGERRLGRAVEQCRKRERISSRQAERH